MNLYADLTTFKSASVGDFASVTTYDTFLMTLLEAASRAVDTTCGRKFYAETATMYFDGVPYRLSFSESDLLQVTTFKVDEDGDGTYERSMDAADYNLYPLNKTVKEWAELSYDSDFTSFADKIAKGVEIAGLWGYGNGRSATPYKASGTTTNEELDASETGVDVVDGTAIKAGQTILVESEQMYVESIATNTLTVIRGVNGTTAATHTTGKAVSVYQYPPAVQTATIMQALRWWKRRESAFQTAVQSEMGNTNVYRGLDPDYAMLCNQFRKAHVWV